MKSHIIISSYDSINNPNYNGGGAKAIHEIARRLSKKYQVSIVTGRYSAVHSRKIGGVPYYYIGANILPRLDQGIFHVASLIYAQTHQYDLWLESFTPPAVTGLLPLLSRKPVIGLAHMLPGEDMARKYKLPFHLLDRLGLKLYRHIIATSPYFSSKIKRMSPNTKVIPIPNGIETIKYDKLATPQHILWLGRVEVNQKGLDLLIDAYRKIAHLTKYPLIIVGSGSNKEIRLLKDLIRRSGVDERIKFVGRVSGKAKSQMLAESAAVVISSRFETFSMVAAEAMAAGVPLITFDLDGLRWIPIRTRFIAPKITSPSLADTLLKALNNPQLAKQRARAGHKLVAGQSWDSITNSYDKLINKALYE